MGNRGSATSVGRGCFSAYSVSSESSFGGVHKAANARISLAGKVHRFGECLEQSLDHVMRLASVKQFQMQVAPCFAGKSLKKLLRQSKSESRGHILISFRSRDFFLGQSIQAAPDQKRPSAEINDTASQAFVHRHIGFADKRVARIESRAVAPNSPFIAQCPREGLTQGDPAILDGVMGVDLKVSLATKLQVHHGVLGEEAEHV